jgi:hypothetical protein
MSLRQKIILKDTCPKAIELLVEEFVLNKENTRLFPPEYIDEIKTLYDENPGSVNLRHFDKLHGYAISYFQDVFENHFRKTKSFSYIKQMFKENETINKRLHLLNLTSVR